MKLHEKIKSIRKEKGLSLKELHRLMVNYYKQKTVTYRTLQRIEAGQAHVHNFTLHQISTGLGITLSSLKKNTEAETRPVDWIKKGKYFARHVFNENAYANQLIRQNRNFMVLELILQPHGKTKIQEDPEFKFDPKALIKARVILKNTQLDAMVENGYRVFQFEKYVYCLKGEICCFVDAEKYALKKGCGLSFESNKPHWFENNSTAEARCLIVQHPGYSLGLG